MSPRNGKSTDWYERAIDEVARTAYEVCKALRAWDGDLVEARRQRADGVPLVEMLHRGIASGSRDRRVAADEAMAAVRRDEQHCHTGRTSDMVPRGDSCFLALPLWVVGTAARWTPLPIWSSRQ